MFSATNGLFLNLLCFEIKVLRQVGEVVSTGILSAFLGSQIVSVVQILIEDSTCSMFAHLMNDSTLGLDFGRFGIPRLRIWFGRVLLFAK